jgi:hypothetical protein
MILTTICGIPISKTKRVLKASGQHCKFSNVDDVPAIGINETISFHANETCMLVKTDILRMKDKEGIDYNFMIEGKRTRIFAYICLMESGGECVLTKHRSEGGGKDEGCAVLESYMYKPSDYAVFLQFERRPRKFSDKEKEARWRRRRHGRSSHRIVAEVTLNSVQKRSKLCLS